MATARNGPVYTHTDIYIYIYTFGFLSSSFHSSPGSTSPHSPRSIRPEIFLWLMQELCSHCTSQPPTFRRPYTTPSSLYIHVRSTLGSGDEDTSVHLQALDSPQGDPWLHLPFYMCNSHRCTHVREESSPNEKQPNKTLPPLCEDRPRFGNRSFLGVSRRDFFSSFTCNLCDRVPFREGIFHLSIWGYVRVIFYFDGEIICRRIL